MSVRQLIRRESSKKEGRESSTNGLGESDDGVDENVGLSLSSSSNGQLPVSSVHRVSSLLNEKKEEIESALDEEIKRETCRES